MESFNTIVNKLQIRQTTNENLKVSIFVEKRLIFSQNLENDDFAGGIKNLTKIINELTMSRKGKPAEVVFTFEFSEEPTVIKFIAGKFALNLKNLIKVAISKKYGLMVGTEVSTKLRKQYETKIYTYFDANINGIIETVKFINMVDKIPLIKLEESFTNFRLPAHE